MQISQPWARRAHRNPQNYIFFPKVGSIYPIKTFIPQMMASYIQYFWQFLTIFENFDNFAKLDFDDFFKMILPSKSSALKVVCPQSRLPSTSWAQRRLPSTSHSHFKGGFIIKFIAVEHRCTCVCTCFSLCAHYEMLLLDSSNTLTFILIKTKIFIHTKSLVAKRANNSFKSLHIRS